MAEIPSKIDHHHIIDSVVEIRFTTKVGKNSFIEFLHVVKEHIPNHTYQPNEIPKQLRDRDPQLKFAVEATLAGAKFSVGIGFNTLVFNCQNGYKTWKEFYPFIVDVLETIGKLDMVEQVTRVGVRFTNFFQGQNDLSKFNLQFTAGSKDLRSVQPADVHQLVLKFATISDKASYNVTIANLASVPKSTTPGTLVDVDAYVDKHLPKAIGKDLFSQIEYVHHLEKEMFFSLLAKDLLKSLNPVY